LAVHLDPRAAQPEDQAAIGESVRPSCGIDAGDPQLTKFPSPRAPVSVGLGQRPRDGLVGELEPPALLAPVAARQLENLSVPALDDNAAFDACITRSPPKDRGRGHRSGSSRSRRGRSAGSTARVSRSERFRFGLLWTIKCPPS